MSGRCRPPAVRDLLGRSLRSLRISVTDRCNLRCAYCMPEESYTWLPRTDLLTFEEILRLVDVFSGLGVGRLRLTGGEPLLRKDLPVLVRMLSERPAVRDLALTTNAVLLAQHAQPLREAGLHRVTVSLDTLRPERFRSLTRKGDHTSVRQGLETAVRAGFQALKINMVVVREFNVDELTDMIEFGQALGAEVRFIEYMDVGGATQWSPERVVSRQEILERLVARHGRIVPLERTDAAPADRYELPDGTVFGIIASTTEPFCGSCDRSRLTADGMWYRCLYATEGMNLRGLLRDGSSAAEIAARISGAWTGRADRGAEDRLAVLSRGALLDSDELRDQPHREMHTRGG